MTQNLIQIMSALDNVMASTAWLGADGRIESLKDRLQEGADSLDKLPRDALTGAYIALQIKTDNFEVAVEGLSDEDLALRVKAMVFSEAKKIIDAQSATSKATVRAA
ncbi:MAG: hypothetical protein FWD33_02570 [Alphaproteobacteria bacterium]|nr:hypothetical protein [Alphaproteobacteria bacterium]